jgi:ABC-2 type transport system permease protein
VTALWLAARHEWRRASRRRTLHLASLLLAGLVAVGFALEGLQHLTERQRRAALQARVDGEWREQPARHPHRAAHFGSFAFRRPGALSFFDPGLESYSGTVTFLEPHQRNLSSFSAAAESSELLRFGRPSAAFILQVLLPLLLFCTTFSSVAGERESGTWAWSLSQGARARSLLLGKALGALAAVWSWLLPVLALGSAGALAVGLVDLSADTVARGALLFVAYLSYLAFCAMFGVLISSLHRRAQPALILSVALWVCLWLVLPRLATAAATELHPGPSRAELETDIARGVRALGDSHDPSNPHFAALKENTLGRYGVSRIEDLPINYAGVVMAESERVSSAIFDAFHDRLAAAYHAQDELTLAAGLYTPLLAIRALSMSLAGTDGHHLARFEADVEAHRFHFIQRLNELHTNEIRWESDKAQRVDRSRWASFAAFSHRQPSSAFALSNVRPAALALAGWVALVAIGLLVVNEKRSVA